MSAIRYELIHAVINGANNLTDTNIHNDIHKHYEFKKQTVLADKSLTEDEKTEAIRWLTKDYDRNKVLDNEGTKRICENCNQECLATLYCEYCVRNYLKANFSNWTSGNNDIDNLIQNCQMESLNPAMIVEWIPYNKLQNIKYLTKGGCSEIYTADWIDGHYFEWDSKKQQLTREWELKVQYVVLKRLENVENANQRWFEEAKSHLTIGNKSAEIVQCYGLTQDPLNGNYMLVIEKMDIDLRKYLQQNHNQLTWKERIKITYIIISELYWIHEENAIHRDLHSGNILYSQFNDNWYLSDLGFCGPADKSPKSIYGNLPYIAPEVISGREYTFASDIYSVGMLMWEISSGHPPFSNYDHDLDLAMSIINGIRPKIKSGTPLKYKSLMEQCWDADPLRRPDIDTLCDKMEEFYLLYKNMPNESFQSETNNNLEENYYTSSKLFSSKIHEFENLPEPRNATEEKQEAFHSKLYDFNIPNNVEDFNKSSDQNNKSSGISKVFNKLKINSRNVSDIQDDLIMQRKIKKQKTDINDEDEIYNNPNLHSEEQDELEIPDGGF